LKNAAFATLGREQKFVDGQEQQKSSPTETGRSYRKQQRTFNLPTEAEMEMMRAFNDDVEKFLQFASPYVSPEGIAHVRHLVDHGEAIIGMSTLAWIIVKEKKLVPRKMIDSIRYWVQETSEEPFLPGNLDEFAEP
jgi:hypothetical protein